MREMEPILCSQAEAWAMLAIGKTKGAELIATNRLETVRIGSRHLVVIASVKRLARVEIAQTSEISR